MWEYDGNQVTSFTSRPNQSVHRVAEPFQCFFLLSFPPPFVFNSRSLTVKARRSPTPRHSSPCTMVSCSRNSVSLPSDFKLATSPDTRVPCSRSSRSRDKPCCDTHAAKERTAKTGRKQKFRYNGALLYTPKEKLSKFV